GISGPNDIVLALSLFLVIFISPPKQYKIWLWVNVVLLLAIHAIEYFYPQLVPYTYQSRAARFVDVTSAYLLTVLTMYYSIKSVKRNYDYEKRQADEKTHA